MSRAPVSIAAERASITYDSPGSFSLLLPLTFLCPLDTLVYIQKFATRSINEFAGRDIFVHGPLSLRLQVLDLLAKHCSDQVSTFQKAKGVSYTDFSTASRLTLNGCSWNLVIHV